MRADGSINLEEVRQQAAGPLAERTPLPVRPLGHPRYRQARTLGVLGVLVLALALVLTPLGGDVAAGVWIFGGSVAFVLLVAALLRAINGRSSDAVAAIARGDYLSHWLYEPGEWQRFAEAEWGRPKKGDALGLLLFGLILGVVFGALLGGAAGSLLLGLIYVVWRWLDRQRYRRALRRSVEAFVSREGVYFDGTFHAWTEVDCSSASNQFIPGSPAVLQLALGSDESVLLWSVPVPAGREQEARAIVRAISRAALPEE
jgi:hypothetical protein